MELSNSMERLINEASVSPSLRKYRVNKGTMFLYCDYAGFAARNVYGAACCTVYDRTIRVTAKKLPIASDLGSNYGEIIAIVHSLEALSAALLEHQPKIAVILTDCSRISQLLTQSRFAHPHDEQGRNELLDALANLNRRFPQVDIQIKYISRHKKNNDLHRIAHHAAREAALQDTCIE